MLAWQGRPEEAEAWIQHAERIAGAELIAGTGVGFGRVALELGRGRDAEALAAARAAEPLVGLLAAPNPLITMAMRAFQLQIRVRLGETESAEQALAGLDGHDRERGDVRIAAAVLRLAQDDPHAAAAALAPVLDGSAQVVWPARLAQAFLLEAIARDRLGDEASAGRAPGTRAGSGRA